MDDYRTSVTVFPLNLILPVAPSLGHFPVPSLPGPKMPHLQLKMPFVITVNGQALRWRFQQPRCAQGPTTLAQTSNESIETAPTRQINPSKMQHDGVPMMWIALLCHLLRFALLSFLSQTEPFSQAHLTSFLTITNNNIFK